MLNLPEAAYKIARAQGWDRDSIITMLLDYIGTIGTDHVAELPDYFTARAADETAEFEQFTASNGITA